MMHNGIGVEGQWFAASGLDSPTSEVQLVWQQRGRHLHAWAHVTMPGYPPLMLHATTDTKEIEDMLGKHPKIAPQMVAAGGDASVGWFGSKVFKKIKKASKNIGLNKVVNRVRTLAQKAIKNPVLAMALRATPYGQLALAINKGAGIAAAAMKGNVGAKNAIAHLLKQYRAGNPEAATALRFIRAGAKQVGVRGAVSGGDDARAFVALGNLYRQGGDNSAIGDDLDALLTMSGAESFAGVRWLLSRMSLQSMSANPSAFGTRAALLDGRNVLASRFA